MILITGAAGFIGSCIVKHFNDQGREDIIVVDRMRDGDKWLNLRGLKYLEFIHADEFVHDEIITSVFDDGVDQVYHMGACSSTTERDMDFLIKNNLEYSKIIWGFCTQYNVPLCYASSAATYGSGEQGYNDDESQIHKLMPLNGYGYSKQLMDEWALKQDKTPEKWYGVKFFNVYGPNEYHKGKMSSVVFQAFNQINENGEVKLFQSHHKDYEDGGQLRDFVYVKDVVSAMHRLINDDHNGQNGIYNLGTGKARSFRDLATATFQAMGKEPNIKYIPMPESLRGQYQYYTQANMDKLFHALPDFTFNSLEDGVKDYVQNHLLHETPYLMKESRES
jgi:ADP-L-glycero-D-manno-heptose 6-epimerase